MRPPSTRVHPATEKTLLGGVVVMAVGPLWLRTSIGSAAPQHVRPRFKHQPCHCRRVAGSWDSGKFDREGGISPATGVASADSALPTQCGYCTVGWCQCRSVRRGRTAVCSGPLRPLHRRAPSSLARRLPRYLRAPLPRLAQADSDRLLAAGHFTARPALQRPMLPTMHRRLHGFLSTFAVLRHRQPPAFALQTTCSVAGYQAQRR